jgi:tRNA dimethylallyltransferase
MDFPAGLVAALSASPPQVDPLAVLLLGPTGSGKTALSLALGERFSGEIVSCDSVAVYRGMDLGTAKPTHQEQARLPHHMIDVADPDQLFTAGEYSRQARAALKKIAERGKCAAGKTDPEPTEVRRGLVAQAAHAYRSRLRCAHSCQRQSQTDSSH